MSLEACGLPEGPGLIPLAGPSPGRLILLQWLLDKDDAGCWLIGLTESGTTAIDVLSSDRYRRLILYGVVRVWVHHTCARKPGSPSSQNT